MKMIEYYISETYLEDEFFWDEKVFNFVTRCKNMAKSADEEEKAFLVVELYNAEKADVKGKKQYVLNMCIIPEKDENEAEEFIEMSYERRGYNRNFEMIFIKDYFEHRKINRPLYSKEDILINKIRKFVSSKDAYKNFNDELNKRVLGQPALCEVAYNVFTWLSGLGEKSHVKNNALLVAPSGCGKTETCRAIADILKREIGDIPVFRLDATQLTPEGFSGKNTTEFFAPLLKGSVNGIAIVVLDEMDKKLLPSYTNSGVNANAEIQSQLLTVIEGIELEDKNEKYKIDTSNTLFIAAGAFQQMREQKAEEKRKEGRVFGFCNEAKSGDANTQLAEISIEDIIKHGGLAEMMGRFSTVINFQELNRDSVAVIIDRYVKEFEKLLGCPITVTDAAVDELYSLYKESDLGCRVLKSAMWKKLSYIGMELEINGCLKQDYNIKICYDAGGVTYKRRKKRTKASVEELEL